MVREAMSPGVVDQRQGAMNVQQGKAMVATASQGPWRTIEDVELATLAWSTGTTPSACTSTFVLLDDGVGGGT